MTIIDVEDLYVAHLRYLYDAAAQVALILPKWEEEAMEPALRPRSRCLLCEVR